MIWIRRDDWLWEQLTLQTPLLEMMKLGFPVKGPSAHVYPDEKGGWEVRVYLPLAQMCKLPGFATKWAAMQHAEKLARYYKLI